MPKMRARWPWWPIVITRLLGHKPETIVGRSVWSAPRRLARSCSRNGEVPTSLPKRNGSSPTCFAVPRTVRRRSGWLDSRSFEAWPTRSSGVVREGQLMATKTWPLEYGARAFQQDAVAAMRGEIIRALIETITNSDDAYRDRRTVRSSSRRSGPGRSHLWLRRRPRGARDSGARCQGYRSLWGGAL